MAELRPVDQTKEQAGTAHAMETGTVIMGRVQGCVAVWLWSATKGHMVSLSTLPPAGMGRTMVSKGQKSWVGIRAV